LVVWREPPSVSVIDLIDATYLPWAEQQTKRVFGERSIRDPSSTKDRSGC